MTRLLLRMFIKEDGQPISAKNRSAIGRLSGAVGIVCNVLLFAAKLMIGILSGSVSITADALNNLSDATGSVVTLAGFRLAEKPADEDHPYGHARYEYLSGLAVAVLIIVIGVELGKSSIEKILAPIPVEISWVMTGVLAGSALVKLWMSRFNRQLSRIIDSSALAATAVDSRNDAISTAVVLVAAMIERFADWRVDGIMGLAMAAFILYSGWNLAKETISPLLGETASPQLQREILAVFAKEPKVLGYHDLMVHDYGPGQRFASVHVEMDKNEDAMLCHEIIDNLERECMDRLGVHLIIHYDPVITGDAELDRLREQIITLLRKRDEKITIHDFRMVEGKGHTNLIFDIVLPAQLMEQKRAIKNQLDTELAQLETKKYYTVVNFDLDAFNEN